MTRLFDRWLPGTEPSYLRFDLTKAPRGFWTLTLYWAEGPGFVRADQRDVYEMLTLQEASDVISVLLD